MAHANRHANAIDPPVVRRTNVTLIQSKVCCCERNSLQQLIRLQFFQLPARSSKSPLRSRGVSPDRHATGLPGSRWNALGLQSGRYPAPRPTFAGEMKFILISRVGANSPGPRVKANVGDSVSSSMAASMPPWMKPTGFTKSGQACISTFNT